MLLDQFRAACHQWGRVFFGSTPCLGDHVAGAGQRGVDELGSEIVTAVRVTRPGVPICPLKTNRVAECSEHNDLTIRRNEHLEPGIRVERAETVRRYKRPKLLVERQQTAGQKAAPREVPKSPSARIAGASFGELERG